jgi:hypothetical protein
MDEPYGIRSPVPNAASGPVRSDARGERTGTP